MEIFFIIFGVFILILLILPAILPSKFSMLRSIDIDASLATVFNKLPDLNEYVKWNPFPEGDPSNTTDVYGTGVGSTLVWKGQKTGAGKMTVVSIESGNRVGVKMEFYKPFSGEGMVYWITRAKSDSQTEMSWSFDQDLSYFARYFGLFMESIIGKHYENGLSKYKALVEMKK